MLLGVGICSFNCNVATCTLYSLWEVVCVWLSAFCACCSDDCVSWHVMAMCVHV